MRMYLGLVLAVALASGGCKSKGKDESGPDPAALKAQAELVARRDQLVAERKRLESEREQIDARIKEVAAKGGDTSELATQRAQLESQIQGQSSDLDQLSGKLDQVVANGGAAAGMAGRENSMAGRETKVASREADVARRETEIARRETELAKREKETCGAAPAPMIIQQVAAPVKPGGYSKADIEPLLNRAHSIMQKKGLVTSDLGVGASLESTTTAAMKDNDWGAAHVAAVQLVGTVDGIRIDRAFITAKYKRLNDRFTASKADAATKEKFEKGMQDVVQLYGDGDHASANKKLNTLAGLLK